MISMATFLIDFVKQATSDIQGKRWVEPECEYGMHMCTIIYHTLY